MNSRQRRQDRRAWKYRIDLGIGTFEDYVDMWLWLDQRFGRKIDRCGWRDRIEIVDDLNNQYRMAWEFLRKKDAVEFALRWA